MSEPTTTTPAAPAAADRRTDPAMQRLYQMSRTAGVGMADYAEVNAFAVAAALFGIAGFAVVIFREAWVLLLIPALAVILGATAAIKIRRSNGTQTGLPIALVGLLLGLAFLAFNLGWRAMRSAEDSAHAVKITDLARRFNDHLLAGRPDEAHALFAPVFRERVKPETFRGTLDGLRGGGPPYGVAVKDVVADRAAVQVQRDAEGKVTAQGLLVVTVDAPGRDGKPFELREPAEFVYTDGGWQIANISSWFPAQQAAPRR